VFIFCLLSLAGIPPLIGFFGKFFVFMSLIFSGHYFLALYGALFSVLTCVYYIRLIRFILFEKQEDFPVYYLLPISKVQAYFVSFITLLNSFFFFFQGPILYFLYNSFIYIYFNGLLDIHL
jgi:NADH:ubiquinone oxidoreductase subunit 2 (subunit N)